MTTGLTRLLTLPQAPGNAYTSSGSGGAAGTPTDVQQRGHTVLQAGDLLVDVGEDVRDIRQPVEVRPSPEPRPAAGPVL